MGADVDAGQDGGGDGAEEDRVERVPVLVAHVAEYVGEGSRVVAG